MSASHFKLDNLVGIVDRNKIQIDGFTEDVMALEPYRDKWEAFCWAVVEINGHDMASYQLFEECPFTDWKTPYHIPHDKGKAYPLWRIIRNGMARL
jgi:transketolase